ncbi:BrnT family toxin [Bartonella queenslandensis]|uniref:BrnT family toxin n=1 Tax=Bartonella queenslandensis TaxID=481138 RepID=UPI0002D5DFAB|nr:BrnT family toxin [Bartonella queenslandensis]
MVITYDEIKRHKNIEKHGLDFADLQIEFFETAIILPAKQGRFMAINVFTNNVIAVVFATLGDEAVSIISMRRASKKERSLIL